MGQELIYSVLARPTLQPKDLVFRRRVSSLFKSEKNKTRSEEDNTENFQTENEVLDEQKQKKIVDLKA